MVAEGSFVICEYPESLNTERPLFDMKYSKA